ncbi:MAG: AAA family ATPase [Saprospiraceae bacterium]
MDFIEIAGYKSIKEAKVELKPINILIGANGAGKSNFISFFEFLNNLYEQKLEEYVGLNGGVDKMLFQGQKITQKIKAYLSFKNGLNAYEFVLQPGHDSFIFTSENLLYRGSPYNIQHYSPTSRLKTAGIPRARYIRSYLNQLKKYHFHDTGKNSPFNHLSSLQNDIYFLYEEGNNLAAFLFSIQEQYPKVYRRIIRMIQSIAPFFSDFFFHPNKVNLVRLQWTDKYSSTTYGATDLSDGTIRFIALTVLFLQPNLPETLIIDEPELGLHPTAIAKLAGMIKSVANRGTQVIIATQSSDLVSHFLPEDIITIDQVDGESRFNRLQEDDLSAWLEDYSIGDLWKRNIISGGQP